MEIDELEINENEAASGKYDKLLSTGYNKYKLTGMYKDWFLDYASYVILERAVPHINDGLKPVQRRILHTMHLMDDGRYNKVANIVGHTMQFHPHGDASIGDALTQLGQKDMLIDCQGNWGNILTGDRAAAPRYIEARLSKFALDVVFNNKTTEWMNSYDGRNQEPVNLPIKFPLLLAQGAEGIAVGLASKILPHNFNELIDASIAYLKGEDFTLYPDFPTGGMIDCERYNNGKRGGSLRIRAKIEKIDKKTIVITEIPYGKTTTSLIESILAANDKGKIKTKSVDDNTAAGAEIVVHLQNDVSPDKTIDALYAFTDCEVSVSPNACVIKDNMPIFVGVDDILRYNTDHTKSLLLQELKIKLNELSKEWHYLSLEKIFFENKVYRTLENDARTWAEQLKDVNAEMQKYRHLVKENITAEDINKLVEKPVRKISKFDIKAANDRISAIESELLETQNNIEHIVDYSIDYFKSLKKKYGDKYPRHTEITSFENINVSKVAANNAKLFINRNEGFIGMDLKKDENAEFVCECSDIDDIIVFLNNGKYMVSKIANKLFVGKGIIHAAVFNRNDNRTVYNIVYRDGKDGFAYIKRCAVTGVTRDKEYDLTQGKPGSKILWFSANSNAEAEVLKVLLKPKAKLKKLILEYDFADLAIKGKNAMGNILSKNPIHKIQLKAKGISTLGGKKIWFDTDINRLNEDERGMYLGEFNTNDKLLAVFRDGTYYTTSTDLSNRYKEDLLFIERFNENKVFSVTYYDGESGYIYIKRFAFETNENMPTFFIPEDRKSYMMEISQDRHPQIELIFGGKHEKRVPETINVEEFIAKKGYKAKGKRVSAYEVASAKFIEPLIIEEEETMEQENTDPENTADPELEETVQTDQNNNIENNDEPSFPIDEESGERTLF